MGEPDINSIRAVRVGDATQLSALMKELGYELTENETTSRIHDIHNAGSEIFVALVDEKIVGCVNAIIDVRLAEGKVGEAVSLVVKEQYRGKGIGQSLMQQASTFLQQAGCHDIRIRANSIRKEAHGLYQKWGFKELKTQKVFLKTL